MKLFTTDLFVLPLPEGHRFPMVRYRLLRERLEQSGRFSADQFLIHSRRHGYSLLLVHTADWVRRTSDGQLTAMNCGESAFRGAFRWLNGAADQPEQQCGGPRCAHRTTGGQPGRGTHHAFPDRGAGYCVFNDVAVAIRTLQSEGLIRTACVVDGDVHQGDGTAAIFEHDQTVRTFSLHASKAFPARKQRSTIDIELPPEQTMLSISMHGVEVWTSCFPA